MKGGHRAILLPVTRRYSRDDGAFEDDESWRDDDGPLDEDSGDEHAEDDGDASAYCPECGALVHDSADICSKCFTWIDGAERHPPGAKRARARRHALVAWILIGSILAGTLLFLVAGLLS